MLYAIVGNSDPEMERIEKLLVNIGASILHVDNAYAATTVYGIERLTESAEILLIEVKLTDALERILATRSIRSRSCIFNIDHHFPGDPGYGRPPSEFLPASSLGQVLSWLAKRDLLEGAYDEIDVNLNRMSLGRVCTVYNTEWVTASHVCDDVMVGGFEFGAGWWTPAWWLGTTNNGVLRVPNDLVYAAASDHCPAAAYAGKCPGVSVAGLKAWSIEGRARFQGRSVEDLLLDIGNAERIIAASPVIELAAGVSCVDLRSAGFVSELGQASLYMGVAILCQGVTKGGQRRKINVLGDNQGCVCRAFLDGWASAQGYVDLYGDPMRGFAGGFEVD